ncbi:MAG: proline dehydrogenase [Planctomycetota bacterium]|jgi:proline dehydrogenase
MPAIWNLFDKAIGASLPLIPKPIVRRFARRYVAGDSLDDAVARVKELGEWGACATLDVLGEEIESIAEGEIATTEYLQVLDRIKAEGLDANISIKLTAFGLKIDPAITYDRVRAIVARAKELGNFVRIDMEDSSTTTETLSIFRRLREEGFENVGVVLQAYMRRTQQDVADHADLNPSYRLCKGIYIEPEEIAFNDFNEINDNYMTVLKDMVMAGSYVGIATHDHRLTDRAEAMIKDQSLASDRYEFQMLLGVDKELGTKLMAAGHKLRIYVPYGNQWYLYCMRRLKENPKIGRYVLFGMFKKN